jgi:ABC-type ATPase with predicted acetyltransferase domain
VGLAEAWSYLRTPNELSEGQRWRLKLAIAMSGATSRTRGLRVLPKTAHSSTGTGEARSSGVPSDLASDEKRLILVIDEFAALLDRITASIVARCLRRAVDATDNLCAIVATSHEDLTRALAPDTIVHCDFRLIEVLRLKQDATAEAPRTPRNAPRGN